MTTRRVIKTSANFHNEAKEIVQAIFVGELLCPSRCLWVVSPWLSDIKIIDNSSGAFGFLDSTWGRRGIRLVEILARIVSLECIVVVVTRPATHNDLFIMRLTNMVEDAGYANRLMVLNDRDRLHMKGLLGDAFYLSGSMNYTYNGLEILEEEVVLETDPADIAEAKLQYLELYGGIS